MMIVPKEQQKLGTAMNGRDSLILFLTESLGIECKDDKIDFSSNAELMKILSKKKNGI